MEIVDGEMGTESFQGVGNQWIHRIVWKRTRAPEHELKYPRAQSRSATRQYSGILLMSNLQKNVLEMCFIKWHWTWNKISFGKLAGFQFG